MKTTHVIYDSDWFDEEENCDCDIFYDEMQNLDRALDGQVLAIADMGLWRGRVWGYKLCGKNLNEIMRCGNEDSIRVYVEGRKVMKDSTHHDGVNHIEFRMVKSGVNVEPLLNKICSGKFKRSDLYRYTKSLADEVCKVYGW